MDITLIHFCCVGKLTKTVQGFDDPVVIVERHLMIVITSIMGITD